MRRKQQVSPISEKTFVRMWQRIERTIDLHGATPHVFRHTYMTFAQRAQIPVKTLQAIGGYADLATLQDRYVHTQNEDIETARAAIEDMLDPPTMKVPASPICAPGAFEPTAAPSVTPP